MSTKVKERLKKLLIELSHEERIELDDLIEKTAAAFGIVLIKRDQKACDYIIERMTDEQVRKLVELAKKNKKKKKKKREEILVEA